MTEGPSTKKLSNHLTKDDDMGCPLYNRTCRISIDRRRTSCPGSAETNGWKDVPARYSQSPLSKHFPLRREQAAKWVKPFRRDEAPVDLEKQTAQSSDTK